MSLKTVKSSLETISRSLSESRDSREFLIKNSREILILCSRSIISVHKSDLKSAKKNAQNAKKLLEVLRKRTKGNLKRYIMPAEQEFVEASALLSIVEKKEIPSPKILAVSEESYILGLLDCVGELKRLVYDKIRMGKQKDASKFFELMENLYLLLYPFATYDKLVKEARRKLDVNRILVEETRGALTEEIRRSKLIETIKNLKK